MKLITRRPTTRKVTAFVLGPVMLGLMAPIGASAAPAGRSAAQVQALAACLKVSDDTARLACYDKAARSLVEKEKAGDVVVVDREQVREAKRQSFGFNIRLASVFDRGDRPEEIKQLTSTVASAGTNADGKWVIHTADGQVWRQIDSDPPYAPPKKGDKVLIRRGALGSYFLKINDQTPMRAHRDE